VFITIENDITSGYMKESIKNSTETAERLFKDYADRMYSFAANVWKFSEDDAWETIYQTIFHIAKVYHKYEFPDDKALANFLITAFNNRLKNKRRDRQRDPIIIQFESIEEQVDQDEFKSTIGNAEKVVSESLDELEEWERILLVQRSLYIPYTEIEKLTGKPEQQLKVYYKRVLAKLEKIIKEKISLERSNEKRE